MTLRSNIFCFLAHTQNGQLADREEIFAKFDEKCTGLQLQTTALNVELQGLGGLAVKMPAMKQQCCIL